MNPRDKRVSGQITYVDVCPFGVGFIVSVGRVTLWLKVDEAEDLLECLGRALMVDAAGDGAVEADTDSDGIERDSTSIRPTPSFRGPRKN